MGFLVINNIIKKISFIVKNMQDAKGHHCGDHVGTKHWTDKKIVNGNCESCAPVRVKIGPLTESNFKIAS